MKEYIREVLRRFGYIHKDSLQEEYLNSIDYKLFESKFDSTKLEDMRAKLRGNKEFIEYCDWTVVQDMKRYFNATPQEQPIIRGAEARTRHFRSLCADAQELKLPIKRYG